MVARLAVEPSVTWIDSQSRKDVMNFWDFDPVEGLGVRVDGRRCNPLIWKVRFRDMLSPQFYWRIRFNFFRLHYQFIMANDRRAPYDYFWGRVAGYRARCRSRPGRATHDNGVLAAFGADGALAADRVTAQGVEEGTFGVPMRCCDSSELRPITPATAGR